VVGYVFLREKSRIAGTGRAVAFTVGQPGRTRLLASAGYRKIILWTNSVLGAARHLDQEEGYKLIKTGATAKFRQELGRRDLGTHPSARRAKFTAERPSTE
jgi:hypothetical protein